MGPEFSPQVPCKNRVDQGIPLAATRRSLGLIGQAIQPNGKLRGSVRDLVSERKVRLIQEDSSLWNTHTPRRQGRVWFSYSQGKYDPLATHSQGEYEPLDTLSPDDSQNFIAIATEAPVQENRKSVSVMSQTQRDRVSGCFRSLSVPVILPIIRAGNPDPASEAAGVCPPKGSQAEALSMCWRSQESERELTRDTD